MKDVNELEYMEMNTEEKSEVKNQIKSFLTVIWHMVLISLATFSVGTLFNHYFTLNYIPSESMESTIMTKDIIVASKYDVDEIKRYDIVVFQSTETDDEELLIKRVIGLPGDTVVVRNGSVLVNGKKTQDFFVDAMDETDGDGIYTVPEGHYFMMGDNRDRSLDSRFWENKYVPLDNILAKAKVCVYPMSHIKSLK